MMSGFFYAATVFMLSLEVGYIYMAPASGSACVGEKLGDKFRFSVPTALMKNMEPNCEVYLIIEGINSAIYEGGNTPNSVLLPVRNATLNYFILDTCPESVVLEGECKNEPNINRVPCSCSTAHSNTTKFGNLKDNSADNSSANRHHYVTRVVIAVLAIVILAIVIYKIASNFMESQHEEDEEHVQADTAG